MNVVTQHVAVGAYWRERKMTGREFIHACYAMLSDLASVSPAFSKRCVVIDQQFILLPGDFQSFEQVMTGYLSDSENSYENPDKSNKSFTLDSTLAQGFSASFSDPDPKATSETAISIFASGGAHGHPNATGNALIKLPPPSIDLVANAESARALLNVMIEVWSPEFASVFSRSVIGVLDPKRTHKLPFGFLMYFADNKAAAICETADVEARDSGGVVMKLQGAEPWWAAADEYRTCFDKLASAGSLR